MSHARAHATPPKPAYPGALRQRVYEPPPANLVHTARLWSLLPPWRAVTEVHQKHLGLPMEPGGPEVWTVGNTELLRSKCVAVVGTRDVSEDGARRARRIARELGRASVVVVSGLAKGVDKEALEAAIEDGGRVVATIGTPVTTAYPAENRRLQERIYRDHLLISQFRPGSRVFPSNFPARNKVMATITDATVIIEASDTSGTLHQAAHCVKLGRWLFIAKSLVDDPRCRWTGNFVGRYPTVRILSDTREVLEALGT